MVRFVIFVLFLPVFLTLIAMIGGLAWMFLKSLAADAAAMWHYRWGIAVMVFLFLVLPGLVIHALETWVARRQNRWIGRELERELGYRE